MNKDSMTLQEEIEQSQKGIAQLANGLIYEVMYQNYCAFCWGTPECQKLLLSREAWFHKMQHWLLLRHIAPELIQRDPGFLLSFLAINDGLMVLSGFVKPKQESQIVFN